MIEVTAYILVGLGLVAGAFIFARRPDFWIEFGVRLSAIILPLVWRYLSKRMTPEEEADYQRAVRAGRGDEWLRRRRGQPPKG